LFHGAPHAASTGYDRRMPGGRARILAIAAALLAGGAAATLAWWWRKPPEPAAFVGSDRCAGCHQRESAAWRESHHYHAMLPAGADSVLGDFGDARVEYAGITSRFFTRDGQYFVETDGPDGTLQEFRIAWTFGWHPLQQYLVEFPDGRLQALGFAWDSRSAEEGGQRWYHLYPDDALTHADALHWTGAFQNWNSRCASCHSTGVSKNYDREQDRYDTRWQEVNVGCEACHGPASRHLAWAEGGRGIAGKGFALQPGATWTPVNGQRSIPDAPAPLSTQLAVCGACHSRRTELAPPDVTREFLDSYLPSALLEGMYHPDGQILDEVFELGSFLQSRMHQNHVSCTNCHEPHGARLRASGNALCLQCHEPARYETRGHHFHEPGSSGAQCVECHMPARTYMGVDSRRDHSFRVPDPLASRQLGVPNACTQCHRDRDDAWAADVLAKLGGRTAPWYAHAALVAGARRGDPAVVPDLLAYARQPANPAILRALAIGESARFPSQQQVDAVADALVDADPLVRIGAAGALDFLAPAERLRALRPLLSDPLKAVRLAAARHLADLPLADAPEADREVLRRVFDEYRAALLHNADMPESMNDLGVFLAAQGDAAGAGQAFQHARRLAPRYLPAMLNLSDAYRARGRDDLGEALLEEALAAYPDSGDVHHMLGLLYVRTGRTEESVALFRRASELSPGNARYALVHALALHETGQADAAVRVLEAAAARFPADAGIRDALEGYRSSARFR
jgi:predicted CXXCH cytochrome family protein